MRYIYTYSRVTYYCRVILPSTFTGLLSFIVHKSSGADPGILERVCVCVCVCGGGGGPRKGRSVRILKLTSKETGG